MPPLEHPPERQWRGNLDEAEALAREYPSLRAALARPESRRQVLRLMAASMAMGGLAGCDPSAPDGHYTPAVNQASDIVPGLPNRFATALEDGGAAAGIIVTQEMGRPIKVEGNPAHPASLGATSIHGQALILDFYDPSRAAGILHAGAVATWQDLLGACLTERTRLATTHGAGLRILTPPTLSPTLGRAIDALLARYPAAQWHQWDPLARDAPRQGLELAYGRTLDLLPRVASADTILALDSDLIGGAPGHLRHARDFASRRNPTRAKMSRVYAAEPVPTLIGGAADHRFIASPAALDATIAALAAAILGNATPADAPPWLPAIIADLKSAGPRALVHAGPHLPAAAHALIHLVNERLGARGTTFDLIDPILYRPEDSGAALATLEADMHAGRVATLLILGANPVYAAPGFAAALARVPFTLATSPTPDETARAATWYLPGTHLFEAWADTRAHDGTVTIQQPQALPLYGGQTPLAALALLTEASPHPGTGRDAVRATWQPHLDDAAFLDALAAGLLPGTANPPVATQPRFASPPTIPPRPTQPLTLLIRPDPNLRDGRDANNPWLQELPRPLGKLVWDNPLLLAPATARRLALKNGDEATLAIGPAQVTAPIFVLPGQAEDTIVAWLGGGRTSAGEVGNGVGTDITPLIGQPGTPTLTKTGRHHPLATTDHHNALDVRQDTTDQIVRHAPLAAFTANPTLLQDPPTTPSIYHHAPPGPVAWAMTIDLNACIGCNACVTACQAENNVPVVGKEQVRLGREMHWLRIDRYYEGPEEDPAAYLQPMLCMHCEDAPCEPVCPVEATLHDSEGLNLQIYNRCIGTRFCSNNCPYKVRRFNFGAWAADEHRPAISRNPDVTVRSRGVMEKCTFCVQRIAETRIQHDIHGTPEHAVTACQAACPTQAFTFGNLADPATEVAQRKHSPLGYALLADQNTHPRVTYEGRITNPNPALAAKPA